MVEWTDISFDKATVAKEYKATIGKHEVHIHYNLHIGSAETPNWYCSMINKLGGSMYLQGTDWGGYSTFEEAKEAAEKAASNPNLKIE